VTGQAFTAMLCQAANEALLLRPTKRSQLGIPDCQHATPLPSGDAQCSAILTRADVKLEQTSGTD
jgi:hypothetical protein